MKLKNVYQLFALMVLFVTLQSRSSGPGNVQGLQVTSAPGSTGNQGTCGNAGCHTQGSFSPTLNLELLNGSDVVTTYEPGEAYNLRVTVTASTGSPSRYGFQAVALDNTESQIGAWGNIGSGVQTVALSNRDYIEHSTPSTTNTFEMEWIAPSAGAGDVIFYSAGLAANANGSTSGDGVANNTITIEEDITNSVTGFNNELASMEIMPNPVNEMLNLSINGRTTGDFNIRVVDVQGRVALNRRVKLQDGVQQKNIPVGDMAPGIYAVQLYGNGKIATVQMLKK